MATKTTPAPLTRTLAEVAEEVKGDWPAVAHHGIGGNASAFGLIGTHPASPYLRAMAHVGTGDLTSDYGYDRAVDIVRYFLSNAAAWRSPVARRVKAELRAAVAHHDAGRRAQALQY